MQEKESKQQFASNGQKLSHLLFTDDLKLHGNSEQLLKFLLQTAQIFSDDIGMTFAEEPCVE